MDFWTYEDCMCWSNHVVPSRRKSLIMKVGLTAPLLRLKVYMVRGCIYVVQILCKIYSETKSFKDVSSAAAY